MEQAKLDYQLIREYVMSSLSSAQLISIYLHINAPERFLVGQVIAWPTSGPITLRLVNAEGEYDGYLLYRPENIYRYEWNNSYLRELSQKSEKLNIPCSAENSFSISENKLVEILGRSGSSLARGYLLQVTEKYVRLQRVRMDGNNGVQCKYDLKNIGGIIYDSKETLRLMQLHDEVTLCKKN